MIIRFLNDTVYRVYVGVSVPMRAHEAMRGDQKKKKAAMALGFGKYDEITDEKEFFKISKNCKKVVAVFFRPGGCEGNDALQRHLAHVGGNKLSSEHLVQRI